MTDFTFLFNRKGALYPIGYNNTNNNCNSNDWPYNTNNNTTLVHLCCKVIVHCPLLTKKVVDIVPNELFLPLFKAALYPVKDFAIDVSFKKVIEFLLMCLLNLRFSLTIGRTNR